MPFMVWNILIIILFFMKWLKLDWLFVILGTSYYYYIIIIIYYYYYVFVDTNVWIRFAYDKSECGCTYSFYASGIAAWLLPLPEVVKFMETSFQLAKQVCFQNKQIINKNK